MRPSDAFGHPRSDAAAPAIPLASGGISLAGSSNAAGGAVGAGGSGSNAHGLGISGAGLTTAPMMTYFLADEATVDAALEAASRDPESFRTALQHARHFHGKPQHTFPAPAIAPAAGPPQTSDTTASRSHDSKDRAVDLALDDVFDDDDDDDDDDDNDNDNNSNNSNNSNSNNNNNNNNYQPPPRPSTPEVVRQHQTRHGHTHSVNTTASHAASLPPNLSPLFSQSTSTSLFGTPGPASLSAMSSPSSRRDSLSGSLIMDDSLISGGGDEDGDEDVDENEIRFGPSISASGVTSAATEPDSDATTAENMAASRADAATAASLLLGASIAGLSTTDSLMMDSGSAPQLIMPSIKMPSRRPFTETGKNMGRLKVLIAGDSGLGKTSLIKAIVQSCHHIVHVDHVTPPPPSSLSLGETRRSSAAIAAGSASMPDGRQSTMRTRRKSSRSARPDTSTSQITEIYASTKPYPAWWSELADGGGLRRRKSLGDNVLDRNICFVDTPGFTRSTSTMDSIMPVIEYVEGYLQKLCTNSLNEADFVGLVSGDGGTSVDVVFYLIADSLKPADIEYLRLLTPLTNVIPLLARADALRTEAYVAEAKEKVARQLHEANIRPFVFTVPTAAQDLALTLASSSGLPQPYAVSSASGSDHDIMDASLLMSPDYVQPLVPTDLTTLVEQVFCPDGISRLRHAAAQKFAKWRRSSSMDSSSGSGTNKGQASRPQALYRPLGFGGNELGHPPVSLGGGAAAVSRASSASVLTTPLGAPSSFALARITDHTQREEHLAQIRLASWAAELQRNLDNERARYETLARNERAVWLTERLSECVQDGTLVAVPPTARSVQRSSKALKKKKGAAWSRAAASSAGLPLSRSAFSHDDPLGLLEVTANLRARGVLVLEVLGSLSVLGGMALWMVRHNYHLQVYQWVAGEWAKLWNGER